MAHSYLEQLQMLREEVKKQLPEIEQNGDWLWAHPETGFREWETQKYCLETLKKHGFQAVTYPDTTGFTCTYDTGKPGRCVMILGEMDSVVCFEHPDCNPQTGAAHACGHSVQMATAMGAFLSLAESGALDGAAGKVMLMGVPAEETVELEWRLSEIRAGRLHYLGGKAEMLYRGAFAGVDVVIGMHTGLGNDGTITVLGPHNGFLAKTVTFQGKAAHAAGSPEKGINALYMANTALTALNGIRETFRDEDKVRVHPIITKGGSISNVIPEDVSLETLCRASNIDAVMDVAEKFDRAMGAGAYAFGGKVKICTQPGYLPFRPGDKFRAVAKEAAEDILGAGNGILGGHNCGSEDFGDLNEVIPGVQVFVNYMTGSHHAADYQIADRKIYEVSSLYLSALACKLLENNGQRVDAIKAEHSPLFQSAEEYCAYADTLFSEKVLP